MDSFCENWKKSKNNRLFVIFGLLLALLLKSQSYEFIAFLHIGP